MKTKISFLILLGCMICLSVAHAQLMTTSSSNANLLANTIVGTGITVTNATINCPEDASGTFSNGNSTNIGIDAGVLMASGLISTAIGPNNQGAATGNLGGAGDPDLNALSGFNTQDACVLEFDFEAVANLVSVSYVFGSEEYLEWVNSGFNDVFGFLVTGPNPGGGSYTNENIATIPVNIPVTINSINPGANATYYVDNPEGGGTTIQYDGFTVVLTAVLPIVPCATYHFKLAIADASDSNLDSGVFIEEASFQASILCNDFELVLGSDGTGSIVAEDLVASDLSLCDFTFTVSQADFICSDEGENIVTVTADDGNGTVLTCDATVTVVVPEDILTIDVGPTCVTVYNGYGPAACTTITATVSGGTEPYTYVWSNGATTDAITVCPGSTTDYYVTATDVNGCVEVSAAVHVIVVDVHCGNNGTKVSICHIPPGNPSNSQTLCVAASSVAAHLGHGDFLGSCSEGPNPCSEGFQSFNHGGSFATDLNEPKLWPNPGRDEIQVLLPSVPNSPVTVQLRSLNGEILKTGVIPEGSLSMTLSEVNLLDAGMYFIRLTSADGFSWTQKWVKLQ
jgi:hypothetical protein